MVLQGSTAQYSPHFPQKSAEQYLSQHFPPPSRTLGITKLTRQYPAIAALRQLETLARLDVHDEVCRFSGPNWTMFPFSHKRFTDKRGFLTSVTWKPISNAFPPLLHASTPCESPNG